MKVLEGLLQELISPDSWSEWIHDSKLIPGSCNEMCEHGRDARGVRIHCEFNFQADVDIVDQNLWIKAVKFLNAWKMCFYECGCIRAWAKEAVVALATEMDMSVEARAYGWDPHRQNTQHPCHCEEAADG